MTDVDLHTRSDCPHPECSGTLDFDPSLGVRYVCTVCDTQFTAKGLAEAYLGV